MDLNYRHGKSDKIAKTIIHVNEPCARRNRQCMMVIRSSDVDFAALVFGERLVVRADRAGFLASPRVYIRYEGQCKHQAGGKVFEKEVGKLTLKQEEK